jgi:penicillin G amidase
MRLLTGTVSALTLGAALWVGTFSLRGAPPLGPFLDPLHGVWATGQQGELPRTQRVRLTGLGATTEVRYDDRGVPHIFAATAHDAYRALGWVHARDRLFQMELTQRAVAGTLAEFVGERALPLDRQARRQGLARAADAKWDALAPDAGSRQAVEHYMEGVNAYVRGMTAADLPLEYRLLRRTPRTFEPRDTYYLLARMSLMLSWSDDELRRGAVEALVGAEAAAALFPVDAPIQEPIEPVRGRTAPRMAEVRLPPPRAPDAQAVARAGRWLGTRDLVAAGMPRDDDGSLLTRGEGVVGSNNWAVAPSRTAAGHALLSGDPHLQLTLPSIWYEAHLVVPGELDVYGVTLPLSPITPIGFNRDVAWTATNTGADVMDFYRETVDDSTAPARYRVDGAWRAVGTRVEEFRDAEGRVAAVDTLRTTHRGPLWHTPLGWVSLRWTALEVSDEGEAFRRASRAASVDEWYEAMRGYRSPAQNFLVADRAGRIGIRSTGRYPLRPGDGRGDRVFDGSTSASDWTGDWPVERYPQSVRPSQGYLASANQQPLDPAVRPGYLGWNWPAPWRALRINRILRSDSAMTPERMRLTHTDPESELTPVLLGALRAAADAARRDGTFSDDDARALEVLEQWDARFDVESRGAVLFDAVFTAVTRRTWDELLLPGEDRRVGTPNSMILARLLEDAGSVWWDDRRTAGVREDRDAILLESLRDGWRDTRTRHGSDPTLWRWSAVRRANVRHLLQLPGLGREGLAVQSGPGTLSPADGGGTHGASWRFVVELGPELRAWGTYPGGQSGNPASTRYDDRLGQWQRGDLAPLRLPRTAADLADALLASTLTFLPE